MELGFVGTGHIASALVEGLAQTAPPDEGVIVSPRGREHAERLAARHPHVRVARGNQDVVDAADVVFLCVRPAVAREVLGELRFGAGQLLISLVAVTPNVLVINPTAPFNTVPELIAYAKANPGKLSFGSGSNGSAGHLAGELFKTDAHIDMVHIPYKGGAPALQALLAGDTQLMFDNLANSMQQVRAGKLKAVAVTTAKRSTLVPELPTLSETGLPGFDIYTWWGFMAPAGTPREIIAKYGIATSA